VTVKNWGKWEDSECTERGGKVGLRRKHELENGRKAQKKESERRRSTGVGKTGKVKIQRPLLKRGPQDEESTGGVGMYIGQEGGFANRVKGQRRKTPKKREGKVHSDRPGMSLIKPKQHLEKKEKTPGRQPNRRFEKNEYRVKTRGGRNPGSESFEDGFVGPC